MGSESTGGERRVAVRDVRVLSTLAHPLRYRLLLYLMASGTRTASQCAEALGDSPPNCSYHLRHLARYGLVERVERDASTDGRERPWRAAVTGFDVAVDPEGPAEAAVGAAYKSVAVEEHVRMLRDYFANESKIDEQWRRSAVLNDYGLRVTPQELSDLAAALDALVRPFIAATRTDAPDAARVVNLSVQGIVSPDAV
jgi:predicted ArsR family transcriptional regulator